MRAIAIKAPATTAALAAARRERTRFVRELTEFVAFPSVSATALHRADVTRCAAWLSAHLSGIGLQRVRVHKTRGHPIVTAQWRHLPDAATLLIYGHYDVQPAEPLAQWRSLPFTATQRGHRLYGRGTADDKGQLFIHLKAVECYLRNGGRLPLNIVCVFEAEEETGSQHLETVLDNPDLAADLAVISDTTFKAAGQPALIESLRGLLNTEISVYGGATELHSGDFGGAVQNPLHALARLISSLHCANGHIAIPGFYDQVRRRGQSERSQAATTGFSDRELQARMEGARPDGEIGFSLYERTTIRPSITVTSIRGGHPGPGIKAAIPTSAHAQLNIRLVQDQDPANAQRQLRQHIHRQLPAGFQVSIRNLAQAPAVELPRNHPAQRIAAKALQLGFGTAPVFLQLGGSIPVVHALQQRGVPAVLMGFGLPDDAIHAPNESLSLPQFFRGIDTCIHFFDLLGRSWRR